MRTRRPAVITVWDGWAVLDSDSKLDGPLSFQPVEVTVDEAADLADDILGGPTVKVTAEWPAYRILPVPPGALVIPYAWTLQVRAFIETEAYEALYAAANLLAGHLPDLGAPAVYRLRDGELVPQESMSSSTSSPAVTGNGS